MSKALKIWVKTVSINNFYTSVHFILSFSHQNAVFVLISSWRWLGIALILKWKLGIHRTGTLLH